MNSPQFTLKHAKDGYEAWKCEFNGSKMYVVRWGIDTPNELKWRVTRPSGEIIYIHDNFHTAVETASDMLKSAVTNFL